MTICSGRQEGVGGSHVCSGRQEGVGGGPMSAQVDRREWGGGGGVPCLLR